MIRLLVEVKGAKSIRFCLARGTAQKCSNHSIAMAQVEALLTFAAAISGRTSEATPAEHEPM